MSNNNFKLFQVSLSGYSELPGFLDALVDAESVLHNSDSDSEFMPSSVGSGLIGTGCIPFTLPDYNQAYHGYSSGTYQNHYADPLYMEENSNSSSNGHDTSSIEVGRTTSSTCFLLESTSLTGSMSMEESMPGSSGTATPLPSFQDTYSPRYRRDVFSFDESAVSPYHHPGAHPASAPPTPLHPFQSQHETPSTTSIPYHHQIFYPPTSPTFEILTSPQQTDSGSSTPQPQPTTSRAARLAETSRYRPFSDFLH